MNFSPYPFFTKLNNKNLSGHFISKVKCNGIFAGHDYLDAQGGRYLGQEWEKCPNGRVHPGAVKVAINELVAKYGVEYLGLTVVNELSPTWVMLKKCD